MTGALLAFSAMAVSVRVLAGALSVIEILAVRAGIGLLIMSAVAAMRPDLRAALRSRHLPLHIFRNTIHLGSQYLWAMSLLLLPLATVFALEFTTPAWTLLLAVPVLGERMTASRVGAVVLGLLGRAGDPASRPGDLSAGRAAGADGGVGFAISLIATKKLTRTDSTFAIIFWMNAIQLPLALVASDPLFVTKLGAGQLPAVVAIGRLRARLALLPDQRLPRRRCERRGAARFPAHPADRGDRLVALQRGARCLRVHRRRPDHRRRVCGICRARLGGRSLRAADPRDRPASLPRAMIGPNSLAPIRSISTSVSCDEQSGAADGGARRRLLEVALPDRVEAVEIVEVGEKHLRLDHLVQR